MATAAPASANALDIAAPMPREPPVTNAVRPRKPFAVIEIFRCAVGSLVYYRRVVLANSSRQGAKVVEFHLLKGPEAEDHTLYASHTVWENRAVFEAWTKSEVAPFRA